MWAGGLDNFTFWVYDAPKISWGRGDAMAPRYEIGQKVTIIPVKSDYLSPRDAGLDPFAGQTGTITNYHWIDRGGSGEVFHVYTVCIEPEGKALILHEDELAATPAF